MNLTRDQKQQIRLEIFGRQGGRCLDCDKLLTLPQMHCHEKIFRSKGGEMSLENSIGLCFDCHINGRHGNRRTRFGEKKRLDNSPEV